MTSTSKDIISHLKRELRLIRFSQLYTVMNIKRTIHLQIERSQMMKVFTSSSDSGDEYENLNETWSQDSEIDDFSDSEAT